MVFYNLSQTKEYAATLLSEINYDGKLNAPMFALTKY
jgi:hypothetical protein